MVRPNSAERRAGEPWGVARGTSQRGSPAGLVGEEPQGDMEIMDSKDPGYGRQARATRWGKRAEWDRRSVGAARARGIMAECKEDWQYGRRWRHGLVAEAAA